MEKLSVEGKEIPIEVGTISGEQVFHIISQQRNDGGVVSSVFVVGADGVVREDRMWRGSGSGGDLLSRDEAVTYFSAATDAEIAFRLELAKLESERLPDEDNTESKLLRQRVLSFRNV